MSATSPADFDLKLKMAQIDAALASHDMMRVQSDTLRIQQDQLRAHTDALRIQQDQLRADTDRKRQEMRFAPWAIVVSSMGTGAALFAAAFALAKFLLDGHS
jgi:hypothetical protein